MVHHHLLCHVSGQWVWSGSLLPEHGVVVFLREVAVFVPPLAKGGHIVGEYGAYGAIWVFGKHAKLHVHIFRHRLDFEAENAELVDDPWHTIGHHAEVFGTHEHTGGFHKAWEFLHCLTIPEVVVATIEVVVVEAVEGFLI